jgi:hypothetical protein
VKTKFEMGSKKYMGPHPAYGAEDMPARILESYVKKGLKSGAGIEPATIAESLFKVASRGEKVPLHLPLGATAVMLIKMKLEARLKDLEALKELSAVD